MPVSKADSLQFMAFLEDEGDLEAVREAVKGITLQTSEVLRGGIKEAIEVFSHQRSPQYLLVDISLSDLPVSDLSRLSDVCEPGVSVIAVGTRNDVGLYRDLMKVGILEYLVRPLFPDILGRALKNMIMGEDKGKKSNPKLGKIIAVAGARGGVGSTFLATNFAAILATEKSRRIVLVDLDTYYGTVALYLDLKSNFGLRSALEDPDRLDQLFLERLLNPVNERLFVLSSEDALEESLTYSGEGLEKLLNALSKLFHYVIVDLPHFSNELTQTVVENAHIMMAVTDLSLAGLRD